MRHGPKLKVLDLFSGIGGFSLGLERTGGFETVAFCEQDDFCQQVLAKHWPGIPIFDDIRKLTADAIGSVDVITGGYPCQPFSQAGQRRGAEDDRHLWPEMYRLVASIRPRWVIAENVAGHISMGLDEVLSDLEGEGYATWPLVIPACAVGAPHRRDRVWIVANCNSVSGPFGGDDKANAEESGCGRNNGGRSGDDDIGQFNAEQDVLMAHGSGGDAQMRSIKGVNGTIGTKSCDEHAGGCRPHDRTGVKGKAEWLPEPAVGRVAHGVPRRVDRLKSLGNTVVPQIPEMIGNAILEAEKLNLE